MDTITGYIGDSSQWAIALTHPITGAAFTPGTDYGLVATFKRRENDPDTLAVIQKATGAGITVSGSTATITLVRDDTEGFCESNLHFGIRATHNETGASFTVAERRVRLEKPTTLETTTSVDVITTETPLPFGGVTSYVSDIESLPDYPASFPTTPADISNVGTSKLIGRHGAGTGTAQEIGIDGGLEIHGGNLRRAAITGPVTVSAGGSVSAIADGALSIAMISGLQNALDDKQNALNELSEVTVLDLTAVGAVNASTLTLTNALSVSNGGTGASTATDARTNLGAQATLVSGTNIKTLNGNSLLGSGDLSGFATLAGAQTFTDQIELSGQAATSATSAMNRGLCDTRYARAWGAALTAGVNSDINTTTYKTVTELSFALDVGTYYIDSILIHNGNASYATSGVKDRLNFTGTATSSGTLYRVLDNATTASSIPNTLASRTPTLESAPTNRSQVSWRKGILTVTAAGTLQVQIAQTVAVAAANTTLDAGSFISITKLS